MNCSGNRWSVPRVERLVARTSTQKLLTISGQSGTAISIPDTNNHKYLHSPYCGLPTIMFSAGRAKASLYPEGHFLRFDISPTVL